MSSQMLFSYVKIHAAIIHSQDLGTGVWAEEMLDILVTECMRLYFRLNNCEKFHKIFKVTDYG